MKSMLTSFAIVLSLSFLSLACEDLFGTKSDETTHSKAKVSEETTASPKEIRMLDAEKMNQEDSAEELSDEAAHKEN
ncbi:hypothetical protein [Pseudobacteriovorax antillogorgiicola]|uniref:Lipoprotein n=1 Tax=Pseudobacteriovorax antillogorgiicola TaxID=1513793 RepID=A0A1Y6CWF2_9BACT|nr:hypothetical protein [Pseudobacteriovorax antillogorgiicola]TCS42852.1 hypothetical protein EDD56_13918 [Pseudobacteriovorax antillogorgiicola]SMF81860.1 hypothetical protein SAMN06296036_13816 [Pseudobacteriovorax antillogorgiicola]